MKLAKNSAWIIIFLFWTTVMNAQSIIGRWEYLRPELRFGDNTKEIPLLGMDIDSDHEKPEYMQLFNDKTVETKVFIHHRSKMKFGKYQMISDGKYVELTYIDEKNNVTIERHQVIEISDETLKLKFQGLTFVYRREPQK